MLCSVLVWIFLSGSIGHVARAGHDFNATIVSIFLQSSELTFDSDVVIPAIAMAVDGVSRLYQNIKFELVVRNSSR
ncbi:hypothetical protein MRX96_048229 [Rhipicephalus microplus]